MPTRTPPRRYTRPEFAGLLLGRLEQRGFPAPVLNRYAAELYTGHAALHPLKEQQLMWLCDLSPEEEIEWRRLMRPSD